MKILQKTMHLLFQSLYSFFSTRFFSLARRFSPPTVLLPKKTPMLRRGAAVLLRRGARSFADDAAAAAAGDASGEISRRTFLEKFAPLVSSTTAPPSFPTDFLPKEKAEETAATAGVPDKLKFSFYLPHGQPMDRQPVRKRMFFSLFLFFGCGGALENSMLCSGFQTRAMLYHSSSLRRRMQPLALLPKGETERERESVEGLGCAPNLEGENKLCSLDSVRFLDGGRRPAAAAVVQLFPRALTFSPAHSLFSLPRLHSGERERERERERESRRVAHVQERKRDGRRSERERERALKKTRQKTSLWPLLALLCHRSALFFPLPRPLDLPPNASTPTPQRQVDLVLLPAVTGDFGVMPGHVPTVAQLRPGVVAVHSELDKEVEKYFVSSGFAFVHADSSAEVCAVEAVRVSDLDPDAVRAGLADHTAKLAALQAKGDDYEIAAAQVGVEVFSAMSAAVGA